MHLPPVPSSRLLLLLVGSFVAAVAVVLVCVFNIQQQPYNSNNNNSIQRSLVPVVVELPSYIEVSLSDLSEPYQKEKHIPFFFHIPKAAGTSLLGYFGTCMELVLSTRRGATFQSDAIDVLELEGMKYVNVDTTTPTGIQHAVELNLVDSGKVDLIKTALFTPSLELFASSQKKAKMFAIFRHPCERHTSEFYYLQALAGSHEGSHRSFFINMTLDQWAQSEYIGQNWMTRMIVNKQSGGNLVENDLILAKEIVRKKCVVGLTSHMDESIRRIESYFNWKLPESILQRSRSISGRECKEQFYGHGSNVKHVNKNKHPDVLPNTDTWSILQSVNTFDLPLYHYAVQLFEDQAILFQ